MHMSAGSDRSRPDAPGWPPVVAHLHVALVADLAPLGPGLELVSRGRLRCVEHLRDADVVLVTPRSPGTLHGLRERLRPGVALVVVDRSGACDPALVADMIEGGATTVVASAHASVLLAHIEAVARRSAAAA